MREDPLFSEFLRLFKALPQAEFLKPVNECTKEEVRAAMSGATPELFLDAQEKMILLEILMPGDRMWEDERLQLARQKATFLQIETDLRKKVKDWTGSQSRLAKVVTEWYRDPEAVALEWGRGWLKEVFPRKELPKDEAKWPNAKALPTVWALTTYNLARKYLVNRDDRKLVSSDFPDWGHYAAAIHADQLVCDDSKFIQIVAECPAPRPVVLTFAEWGRSMLEGGDGAGSG